MAETKPQFLRQNIKAAGFHLKSFESFWQNLLYSLYWLLYVLIYIPFLSNKHILFPWTEKHLTPWLQILNPDILRFHLGGRWDGWCTHNHGFIYTLSNIQKGLGVVSFHLSPAHCYLIVIISLPFLGN